MLTRNTNVCTIIVGNFRNLSCVSCIVSCSTDVLANVLKLLALSKTVCHVYPLHYIMSICLYKCMCVLSPNIHYASPLINLHSAWVSGLCTLSMPEELCFCAGIHVLSACLLSGSANCLDNNAKLKVFFEYGDNNSLTSSPIILACFYWK